MEVSRLYDLAKQHNIEVIECSLPQNGSLSLMDENGKCYIGMDESVMDGDALERVHMAHELGHCETGSFYSIHTAVDCRRRHENRADKWAVRHLITESDLDLAVADGHTEIWDLADHFGVTEQFMRKAVCYYVHGNMAAELYF
ncbi:MAG: ImmA/IrrE family metallo-endopeptidase [Oscillospiraceae bacterium]|nr:ImmA/IrrE family metallo-endopeptidase [Oscillospiraceae bacterium]